MSDAAVLFDLGLVVCGAAALLVVARPLSLPPILAYLLAGLALGPAAGLLRVSGSLDLFSEMGVSLLLFLVGLELSLPRIREIGGTAVVVGVVQVTLTAALGAAVAAAFGLGAAASALLGLVAAFSSTVVVVKLLDRAEGLDRPYGRLAVGVLLVQDVLVAVVLTLLTGLGPGSGVPGRGGIASGLVGAFGGMALLVGTAVLAVRWVLPGVARWLGGSGEALFTASLTWCFGFILAAEVLHVSTELGAFVAGVALAQLPEGRGLRRRVHPLVDFFVAVFFVSLGAGLDLGGAASTWPAALALAAVVLVAKPALVCLLLLRTGHDGRTAFLSGLTLGQVSEFGFVLAALAVGAGLADATVLPLVGLVGLLTIGASALLVPAGERAYRAVADRFPRMLAGGAEGEPAPDRPSGHVVVVGMNDLGRRIVRALSGRGEPVVAVDTDPVKLSDLAVPAVVGDISVPGVLDEAGVPRARLVVSALRIEDVNGLLAYRCRELGVPVAIHAFEPEQAEELLELGVDHVLVSKHEVARELAAELRAVGAVG